jgi:hypothetical protein
LEALTPKTTDYLNHVNVSICVISVKFPLFITLLSPRGNLNLALSRSRMFTGHCMNVASERLSMTTLIEPPMIAVMEPLKDAQKAISDGVKN